MDRPLEINAEIMAANYALGCDLVLFKTSERVHLPTIEILRYDLSEKRITRKKKDFVALVGDRPDDQYAELHVDETDIPALVDLVEKKLGLPAPPEVSLTVNGHRVPLLPFVEDIIANAFLGMVVSLKGCQFPETIDLKVQRKKT